MNFCKNAGMPLIPYQLPRYFAIQPQPQRPVCDNIQFWIDRNIHRIVACSIHP